MPFIWTNILACRKMPHKHSARSLRRRYSTGCPGSINYLDGSVADTDAECNRYAKLLSRFPPDIVCMGIGENGHIAFNDPHVADFNDPATVKMVTLDLACIQQQVNDG